MWLKRVAFFLSSCALIHSRSHFARAPTWRQPHNQMQFLPFSSVVIDFVTFARRWKLNSKVSLICNLFYVLNSTFWWFFFLRCTVNGFVSVREILHEQKKTSVVGCKMRIWWISCWTLNGWKMARFAMARVGAKFSHNRHWLVTLTCAVNCVKKKKPNMSYTNMRLAYACGYVKFQGPVGY